MINKANAAKAMLNAVKAQENAEDPDLHPTGEREVRIAELISTLFQSSFEIAENLKSNTEAIQKRMEHREKKLRELEAQLEYLKKQELKKEIAAENAAGSPMEAIQKAMLELKNQAVADCAELRQLIGKYDAEIGERFNAIGRLAAENK